MDQDKWIFASIFSIFMMFIGAIVGLTVYGAESRLRCLETVKDKPSIEMQMLCGRG